MQDGFHSATGTFSPGTTHNVGSGSPYECPICLRPAAKVRKWVLLYDVPVCRKCRNAFANRRQAAYLIDAVLYLVLAQLGMAGIMGIQFSAVNQPASTTPAPQDELVMILIGLTSWIIFPLLFALKDGFAGRSPGKLLFGVQVVDVNSREPIGPLQSLKRNAVLIIPWIGVIGVILTMMKGRRWGDGWARTMVVWRKHAWRVPFARSGQYCRECGYDLTGNVSGRCPECGRAIVMNSASET